MKYNKTADEHWLECICGFKTEAVAHSYTDSYNKSTHYELCECGLTQNEEEHTLVLRCDPNYHWYICTDCEYSTEHAEHEFESKYNDTQHWHECECGWETSPENHTANIVTEGNYYWTECDCGFASAKVEKEEE